ATVTVHVGGIVCAPECQLPGGGCDPGCTPSTTRDAKIVAPKPLRARIAAGASEVTKIATLTIRNMDAAGALPGPVRIEATDGDCPAGTVTGASIAGA